MGRRGMAPHLATTWFGSITPRTVSRAAKSIRLDADSGGTCGGWGEDTCHITAAMLGEGGKRSSNFKEVRTCAGPHIFFTQD